MTMSMINGSPKPEQANNSAILLRFLKNKFPDGISINEVAVKRNVLTDDELQKICKAEIIVIALPLYFDAIPSHILSVMVEIEKYRTVHPCNQKQLMYAIINNGFYEGSQCEIALEIIQHWCTRIGVTYGQGIGCGAGEMLPFIENVPLGHGPLKNIGTALNEMYNNIIHKKTGENRFVNPNFPYCMWKFMATNAFWKPKAKNNGLTKNDLLRIIGM